MRCVLKNNCYVCSAEHLPMTMIRVVAIKESLPLYGWGYGNAPNGVDAVATLSRGIFYAKHLHNAKQSENASLRGVRRHGKLGAGLSRTQIKAESGNEVRIGVLQDQQRSGIGGLGCGVGRLRRKPVNLTPQLSIREYPHGDRIRRRLHLSNNGYPCHTGGDNHIYSQSIEEKGIYGE